MTQHSQEADQEKGESEKRSNDGLEVEDRLKPDSVLKDSEINNLESGQSLNNEQSTNGEYVEGEKDKRVHIESSEIAPRIRVKGIVVQCVQSSAALVKDLSDTSRGARRVDILLQNINKSSGNDTFDFLHGVQIMLARLLTEKEQSTGIERIAKSWMAKEAAATGKINKAGTFRSSCHQVLCEKVTPVFAGLIAILDTDSNLDLLEAAETWKRRLWIIFINTPEAADIKFEDFRSTQEDGNSSEITAESSGYERHSFRAKFPFSWVISRYIEDMRKKLKHKNESLAGVEEDKAKFVMDCKALVLEHGVGRVLQDMPCGDEDYEGIVNSYAEDYLHTMYNGIDATEFQMVKEVLWEETMRTIKGVKIHLDIVGGLICTHIVFEELSSTFADYRSINSIWPECSTSLKKFREEKPNHSLSSKEHGIVFPALCLMINSLTPTPNEQENIDSRMQWLDRVNLVRPVIEKVLSPQESDDAERLKDNKVANLARIEHTWNRVMTLKLFIQHICIPLDATTDNMITWKRCGVLWALLGEDLDFTTLQSFDKIEKYLTLCNKKAFQFFYGTDFKKCSECETTVETPPVFLPCSKNHIICDNCYDEIRAVNRNSCELCKEIFSDDWEPEAIEQKREEKRKLVNYQEKCNSFLMAVISQLCFFENKAPCQAVIEKLFGYITCSKKKGQAHFTREMTMFNTGVDRSPIFRSYLIQLLVRCSGTSITLHLQEYFDKALECMKGDGDEISPTDIMEFCLLFIQCFEDSLMQKAFVEENRCAYAEEVLNSARKFINSDTLNVEKVYSLAKARMGLRIVADHMNGIVQKGTRDSLVSDPERRLFTTASHLCMDQKSGHARQFLVKYMCRTYGRDRYTTLCDSKATFFNWIKIHEENMTFVDRFLVCGEPYKDIRKCLLSFLDGKMSLEDTWRDILTVETDSTLCDLFVQLSVVKEVTCVCIDETVKERVQQLTNFIEKDQTSETKENLLKLLRNEMQPTILRIKADDCDRTKGVKCLLIHFLQILENFQWAGTFMHTFVLLLKAESSIQTMLLPTMPQDDIEDVKKAIQSIQNESAKLYRCPNGHPYVIGNCGRPWTVAVCTECGAQIGGHGHQAHAGNVLDELEDQTKPGHVIGAAESRGPPIPERNLTATTFSITRLFLHMALLGGAGRNNETICSLIKPVIEPKTVENFLWKHIQKDIDDLEQSTRLSFDDAVLLMHSVISSMIDKSQSESCAFGPNKAFLNDKSDRQEWEILFTRVALDDNLKRVNEILEDLNKELAADDPFHCIIHDIEKTKGTDDLARIAETSKTWRYRTPVSMEHLQQELEQKIIEDNSSLKILRIFLKEDHVLQAVRFVPNIMKLHRILLQRYHMRLDRSAANRRTTQSMKSDKVAGPDTEQLLKDFADAWEISRHYLQKHVCNTEDQGQVVAQKDLCAKPITDDTPLSLFLPATKGHGLCSYALLDFLLRRQNAFLDDCGFGKRASVKPTGLTTAHLISYDHENDIKPLILANCQSTFIVGQENKIEYDFQGIERQLVDQYLISKSKVEFEPYLKIDTMKYATEVTRADVFMSLQEKIPQVELEKEHMLSIDEELHDLPDLWNSIDQLRVTISFLRTMGGHPDTFLNVFMTKTLQLEKTALCSQKARQVCTLGHVRSLWLLLSHRKSKLMVDCHFSHDVVFEHIDEKYHQTIPVDLTHAFQSYVSGLPEDTHAKFVSYLHECLLLHIATSDARGVDPEDYFDTSGQSLRDTLIYYKDDPDVPEEILQNLPEGLLNIHTVCVWIESYIAYIQKLFITRHVQRF